MTRHPMTDTEALDAIEEALNVESWSADTLDTIAEIVCTTGRMSTQETE